MDARARSRKLMSHRYPKFRAVLQKKVDAFFSSISITFLYVLVGFTRAK